MAGLSRLLTGLRAAHIHEAAIDGAYGPIRSTLTLGASVLGQKTGKFSVTLVLSSAVVAALNAGRLYIDFHTSSNFFPNHASSRGV